ncbi:MAG: OPT family oligopeptide transporter [Halobacteria archaeon]
MTDRDRFLPDDFQPHIPADRSLPEITVKAVILGVIINALLTAANVYLGMNAGMTITASIPAAVLAMSAFYFIGGNILEGNVVQTMVASGSGMAGGILFSYTGMYFLGGHQFSALNLTVLALIGGSLGILFMIPMREYLIVEKHHKLPYPEGIAAADVLKAGEVEAAEQQSDKPGNKTDGGEGLKLVSVGFLISGVYVWIQSGFGAFAKSLNYSFNISSLSGFSMGIQLKPSLFAVGYIIGPKIAMWTFAGGILSWMVLIPLLITGDMVPQEAVGKSLAKQADAVWSSHIRYVGAGMMLTGGLYRIFLMRGIMLRAVKAAVTSFTEVAQKSDESRISKDISMKFVLIGAVVSIIALFFTPKLGIIGAFITVFAAFLFVAVSAYIVGLVGMSSNPASGMIIATVVVTALVMKAIGVTDPATVLIVATPVAAAIGLSGDLSQDLKTGLIVGSTPRSLQIAQFIGVVIGALLIGFILDFYNEAFTIGSEALPAPQAKLMATVSSGVLEGSAEWGMMFLGLVLAIMIILLDIPVLPVAVGAYLPIANAAPIFVGGILKGGVDRYLDTKGYGQELKDKIEMRGRIVAAGYIAGGAIIGGVLIGALKIIDAGLPFHYFKIPGGDIGSIIMFGILVVLLVWASASDGIADK